MNNNLPSSADKRATATEQVIPLRPLPGVNLCKRGERRAEKILDAATEVFAQKGYQHAKLSEIVALAGGSLSTLYRIYGDKEGLVSAILERRLDNLVGTLDSIHFSPDMPPEEALRRTAVRMAEALAKPDSLVAYRIVIGEGQQFPHLREWFFEHAVVSIRNTLTAYFEQEIASGRLKLVSAEAAAMQFYGMIFSDFVIRAASGYITQVDPDEVRERALFAVDLFLRGALPR